MCSIMGYCDSRSLFLMTLRKGFDRTISRGPDDSRIIDTGKGSAWLSSDLQLWGFIRIRNAAV